MNQIDIKVEWFANKRSYYAFIYAIECCQKLQNLANKGYTFIDQYSNVQKNWEIEIDGSESCVLLDRTCFAGGEWVETPEGNKIWCTKKAVDSFLRHIRCIPPSNLKTALSHVS